MSIAICMSKIEVAHFGSEAKKAWTWYEENDRWQWLFACQI
jgi:hypothetical protein